MAMAVTKTGLTVAALAVTAYSRRLGQKVSEQTSVPLQSDAEPAATTSPEVADAQNKLRILQRAVPAITGALVIVSAFAGEQQRPVAVQAGSLDKLNPLS